MLAISPLSCTQRNDRRIRLFRFVYKQWTQSNAHIHTRTNERDNNFGLFDLLCPFDFRFLIFTEQTVLWVVAKWKSRIESNNEAVAGNMSLIMKNKFRTPPARIPIEIIGHKKTTPFYCHRCVQRLEISWTEHAQATTKWKMNDDNNENLWATLFVICSAIAFVIHSCYECFFYPWQLNFASSFMSIQFRHDKFLYLIKNNRLYDIRGPFDNTYSHSQMITMYGTSNAY